MVFSFLRRKKPSYLICTECSEVITGRIWQHWVQEHKQRLMEESVSYKIEVQNDLEKTVTQGFVRRAKEIEARPNEKTKVPA